MVANLGNVVELMMSGAKSAMAFGGALAGVTAGVLIFRKIRDALREAREEQEKLNDAVAKQQQAKLGPAQQIQTVLAQEGQGTAKNVKAAQALSKELAESYGVADPELAATGVAAGITSPEGLAVLAAMKRRQMPVGTAKEVRSAMEAVRQEGTYEGFLSEARAYGNLPAQKPVRARAGVPGAGGEYKPSIERIGFMALQGKQSLPDDMSFADFKKGLERLAELRRLEEAAPDQIDLGGGQSRAELDAIGEYQLAGGGSALAEATAEYGPIAKYLEQIRRPSGEERGPVAGIEPEVVEDSEAMRRTLDKLKPQPTQPQRRESPLGLPASVPGEAGPVPEAAPTIINNDNRQVTNIGTQYNAPSRIPPRWPVARVGNNKHDIRSPAA